MQDLITKKTGNSRFLKSIANFKDVYPTYDAMAEALIAGTFPVDFNGLNPAGITQMGTPFAKSQVLTDETAALYGLSSTAMPDDVYAWIGEGRQLSDLFTCVEKITTSKTWTAPSDIVGTVRAYVFGGGGGGGGTAGKDAGKHGGPGGGGGGHLAIGDVVVAPGRSVNAIIGAGSVVTRDIPADTVAAGNPARVLKTLEIAK